jgi:hypothetical protein
LLWFVVAGAVWVALVLLWPRIHKQASKDINSSSAQAGGHSSRGAKLPLALRRFGTVADRPSAKTAEDIVADKVRQFGHNRRAIAERIAHRLGQKDLPPEVDAFFKAVDRGDWDETHRLWQELATHAHQYAYSKSDRPDLQPYWSSVLDAYGVAEQAHNWPAQKLLDYGNAILDSLRPGMVYVGGTDNGRWVPELMNETSGDPHIMITQNALADGDYLDFVRELYGDQFNTLSKEDSDRAFAGYTTDAQKRYQHDLDFPDEPKQVLPGENIKMVDGKVQVSGQTSVMGINEKLVQMLMAKNPDLSFAMQESFSMHDLYPDAQPLGPLMELNPQGDQGSFTAADALQSVNYWRFATQNLLADSQATGSDYALGAYSKDINSTANLLAAHNFTSEAEQAYQLASQVSPGNVEPVKGLAQLWVQTGHGDQARALLDDFERKYPGQRAAVEQASAALWTVTVKKP